MPKNKGKNAQKSIDKKGKKYMLKLGFEVKNE